MAAPIADATRVIVVDDSNDMRISLRLLLSQLGYEVDTALDGEEALRIQRRRTAHLLITDLFMAGKEGIETITAFRRDWPLVRIVAMSGGGMLAKGSYLEAASIAGAHATLQKPFTLQSLRSALALALAQV